MTKAYRFNAPALLCLLLCLCTLIPVVAPRASLAEMPAFTQTLAEGDEGEAVRALQERLTHSLATTLERSTAALTRRPPRRSCFSSAATRCWKAACWMK